MMTPISDLAAALARASNQSVAAAWMSLVPVFRDVSDLAARMNVTTPAAAEFAKSLTSPRYRDEHGDPLDAGALGARMVAAVVSFDHFARLQRGVPFDPPMLSVHRDDVRVLYTAHSLLMPAYICAPGEARVFRRQRPDRPLEPAFSWSPAPGAPDGRRLGGVKLAVVMLQNMPETADLPLPPVFADLGLAL